MEYGVILLSLSLSGSEACSHIVAVLFEVDIEATFCDDDRACASQKSVWNTLQEKC